MWHSLCLHSKEELRKKLRKKMAFLSNITGYVANYMLLYVASYVYLSGVDINNRGKSTKCMPLVS